MKFIYSLSVFAFLAACRPPEQPALQSALGTFGYDLEFLRQHTRDLIVLGDTTSGAIVISPGYQGRVMTSTVAGMSGRSLGWINHDLIAEGNPQPHITAVGGEDRLWLGPEGGQFGFYFPKGAVFNFDNWAVPAALDTEPFKVVSKDTNAAMFTRDVRLENHSGFIFSLHVERIVRLLDPSRLDSLLHGSVPPDVSVVAFETDNRITNAGEAAFDSTTGLPSIWILSMLQASEDTWIGVPFKHDERNSTKETESPVNDAYFGKVPPDRLIQGDSLVRFRADAKFRSKIGVPPERALPWICSFDPGEKGSPDLLTLAFFDLPEPRGLYVNSAWEVQAQPFGGDVANAYNDGPNESGKSMGNFYELESSSPGGTLKPGETLRHRHITIHLSGPRTSMESVFRKSTKMSLGSILGK